MDGAERMRSAIRALDHLSENGIIILDNSEWFPNCAALLREKGFSQIDFCGFAPLNSFTSMTSVFVKTRIVFPYKPKSQCWVPIGGKLLDRIPPDDKVPVT